MPDGTEKKLEAHGSGDCYLTQCPFCRNGLSFDLDLRVGTRVYSCHNCGVDGNVIDVGSPEPVPSSEKDPLEEVYCGWAGEFSKVYSQHTEAPRSFYFVSALTCLGLLLSDKITLASEIRPQSRLYTVILGESGDDRKSTAINLTVDFFRDGLEGFPAFFGVGSAEGFAEQFKKKGNKLVLVLDEFGSFLNKTKIEGSVLLHTVNSLFELNYFQSATKKHMIDLKDVHLAFLAASTVDMYMNIRDPRFRDIGFINRLLVVKAKGGRRFPIPKRIDPKATKGLRARLGELLKIYSDASGGGPVELNLTAQAHAVFDDWYFHIPASHLSKRLDTYALRLMPLLAANEGKTEIDLKTVERVIALMDYEYTVRQEVDPLDTSGKIPAMEMKIRNVLRKGARSVMELKQFTNYARDGIWVFNTALTNLCRAKEVRFDPKTRLYSLAEEQGETLKI